MGQHSDSVVYFVQRSDGLVKIGTTCRFRFRMVNLISQVGFLRLMGLQWGSYGVELDLHKTFAGLRREGEWFEYVGDLCDYIDELDDECAAIAATFPLWTPRRQTASRLKAGRNSQDQEIPVRASDEIVCQIRQLKDRGHAVRQIALELGISRNLVQKYLSALPAPLSDDVVRRIGEMAVDGFSEREIATTLGISAGVVNKYKRLHRAEASAAVNRPQLRLVKDS